MATVEKASSGISSRIRLEPPRGRKQMGVFESVGIECCESAAQVSQASLSELVREISTLAFEFMRLVSISVVVFEISCIRFWLGLFRKFPGVALCENLVYSTLSEGMRMFVVNRRLFRRLSSLSSTKRTELQLVTTRTYSAQDFSGVVPAEGGVIASGLCLLDVSIYSDFRQLMGTMCQLWRSGWTVSLTSSEGYARFGFFWDLAVDEQPGFVVIATVLCVALFSVVRAVLTTGRVSLFPVVVYYPRERDGWVFQNACWIRDAATIPLDKSS